MDWHPNRGDAEKSLRELANSLRAQRSGSVGDELWTDCIEIARKRLLKERQQKHSRELLCLVRKCCRNGLIGLIILVLSVGIFLYLCKPASFFLKRKLHSGVYPVSRLTRKCLLTLHPYLQAVGIDFFSSCLLRHPFISDGKHCPTAQDLKEWKQGAQTLPRHIIKASRNGEWWILRSIINISSEVTVERLYQFSLDNAGQLPQICQQIVGGGEDSTVTAFYSDIFDIWKMKDALKSPFPWSLSWVECPDEKNQLSLHSIFPPLSHIFLDSSMSLISFSTEWCITFHYQTDWPSTLLSLVVVKGEVRVIPVITLEKDCQRTFHGFWKNPILLKEGDAVLFDYRYWNYEVQTWSNYSITTVSSLLTSSGQK